MISVQCNITEVPAVFNGVVPRAILNASANQLFSM